MGPAVQAAGVTGVPAVGLRKGKSAQLQTVAGLARTTTMPDLSVDSLLKVETEVASRLHNANRRYRSEVVAAAQQRGLEPEPVVGSPGSLPGIAALW